MSERPRQRQDALCPEGFLGSQRVPRRVPTYRGQFQSQRSRFSSYWEPRNPPLLNFLHARGNFYHVTGQNGRAVAVIKFSRVCRQKVGSQGSWVPNAQKVAVFNLKTATFEREPAWDPAGTLGTRTAPKWAKSPRSRRAMGKPPGGKP